MERTSAVLVAATGLPLLADHTLNFPGSRHGCGPTEPSRPAFCRSSPSPAPPGVYFRFPKESRGSNEVSPWRHS